jgi:Ca2+/Na+ antiporter
MQIGFEKYYDPSLPNMLGLWFDRAHNIFLDIAGSTGILSLLIYLVFWIVLFWKLQITKKENPDKSIFIHGLQASFIAYFVVMMFNFDSFLTYLILFFNIGFALYLISGKTGETELEKQKKHLKQNKKLRYALFALLILFIFFFNLRPLYANLQTQTAKELVAQKKCDKALIISENAIKNDQIIESYARMVYADIIKSCSATNPEKQPEYSFKAENILKENIKLQPKYTRNWIFLAGFKNYEANKETDPTLKKRLISEAKDYALRALELSPKRQEALSELMKSYLIAQDYQTLKKEAEHCLVINSDFSGCYWYLGISELYLGDIKKGKENIKIADKKGYSVHSIPSLVLLANVYIPLQDYQELAWVYQDLVALQPNNAQYHASLALIKKELGDYSGAINEAVLFLKLTPNAKEEVQNFIGVLTGLKSDDYEYHLSLAYLYKEFAEYEKAKTEILLSFDLFKKSNDAQKTPDAVNVAQQNLDKFFKEISELESIQK